MFLVHLTFASCCSVVKMRSSLLTGLLSRAASGRSFSTSVALNDKIKEFVVIGGGLMGAGIAQVKTHNMPLHGTFLCAENLLLIEYFINTFGEPKRHLAYMASGGRHQGSPNVGKYMSLGQTQGWSIISHFFLTRRTFYII